jgi:hypothetical protein
LGSSDADHVTVMFPPEGLADGVLPAGIAIARDHDEPVPFPFHAANAAPGTVATSAATATVSATRRIIP